MTTRFYHHPVCLEHLTPPGHPERPDRLRAIEEALSAERFHLLDRIEAPAADPGIFTLVHPKGHVERIEMLIPQAGLVRIDADTTASPKSWEAAKRAVGAAVDAVDAVFSGAADNAFCAMRPPGHHAETNVAMGFCLVNTVAIAARSADKLAQVAAVRIQSDTCVATIDAREACRVQGHPVDRARWADDGHQLVWRERPMRRRVHGLVGELDVARLRRHGGRAALLGQRLDHERVLRARARA